MTSDFDTSFCMNRVDAGTRINRDLDMEKFFAAEVGQDLFRLVDRPSISQHGINGNIYYSASACPIINRNDQKLGSCFEGLTIPPASYCFTRHEHTDLYRRYCIDETLDINTYTDRVNNKIRNNIKNIYAKHQHVVLAFSGGIDSLVLLAYIWSLDLLGRTSLIMFENHSQSHPSCLHLNTKARLLVSSLTNRLETQCRSLHWQSIGIKDIADVFNQGTLADLKCYSTKIVLDQFRDCAVLFGWYGNQVLLHKDFFLDQILLSQPSQRPMLEQHLRTNSDFYTQNLKDYDVHKSLIPLRDRYLVPKPWPLMSGHNGNRAYGPLADDEIFMMTRSLDFSKIDPVMILDASLARHLISSNCPELVDYIGQECVSENDTITEIQIPADLIDMRTLTIPPNLKHDPRGLQWLQEEIQAISHRGYLAINSAVSIRALQFISEHFGHH